MDRGKVSLKLLFRPAFTDAVGLGDAVGVEIFRRCFLRLPMAARFLGLGIIRDVRPGAVR
jgi:hypothetical protein